MQKLIGACLLLVIIVALQSKAFAEPLNCTFTDALNRVEGIESLQVSDDTMVINNTEVIQLEVTRIKCGPHSKQLRFDGVIAKGLQVILKTCANQAALEGHLIDTIHSKVAGIVCDEMKP